MEPKLYLATMMVDTPLSLQQRNNFIFSILQRAILADPTKLTMRGCVAFGEMLPAVSPSESPALKYIAKVTEIGTLKVVEFGSDGRWETIASGYLGDAWHTTAFDEYRDKLKSGYYQRPDFMPFRILDEA